MSSTFFVDGATVVTADWLNQVNTGVFTAIGDGSLNPPTTPTQVKTNIGLGNVDNTSDANKPISTATQTALNLKADKSYVDSQDALKSNITTTVTKDSSTGVAHLPAGTTAQRPVAPANGDIRYNSDTSSYEGYKNGNWLPLGGGATGGGTNDAFYENSTNVTANYTITTGKNAGSFGPITINDGVTVTVPNGSVWSIV